MSKKNRQRIWDLPVRLLHWTVVACVAGAWYTSSRIGMAHEVIGYIAGGALALRLVWGFFGNRHARFGNFVRGPNATLRYLRAMASGHAPRYIGHNPLGGWMVVALLTCLAALTATGWLGTTDRFWGYAWLVDLHAAIAWLLVTLVAVHVAGVIWTSRHQRENLIAAMITGDKRIADAMDVD